MSTASKERITREREREREERRIVGRTNTRVGGGGGCNTDGRVAANKKGRKQGLARGWKRAKRRELKGRTNAVRELGVIQSRSANPHSRPVPGKKYCLSFADTFPIPFFSFLFLFFLFVQGAKRHFSAASSAPTSTQFFRRHGQKMSCTDLSIARTADTPIPVTFLTDERLNGRFRGLLFRKFEASVLFFFFFGRVVKNKFSSRGNTYECRDYKFHFSNVVN